MLSGISQESSPSLIRAADDEDEQNPSEENVSMSLIILFWKNLIAAIDDTNQTLRNGPREKFSHRNISRY